MGQNQKRNKCNSRKNNRKRRKTRKNSWFGEERRIILKDKINFATKRLTEIPDKVNKDIRKK